ncbi:zinc ABC transporter substrate-binding protein [Paenalcaligenes niemegkensis]|uniref:metal ABC transporter solute-binding protein, Zn/Mn family n=1 Tax=Paenalcaligenes niemegkensis TaxID=2895469 RepID=UPI001EE8B7C7|nr:zinc ABC transporter substrate-binding protein [Paenalcaligenes niemegkensis]MCQ9617483.1 zinc ABC transporter substrate-binding protein [Paenalcaligenes niemegkensis]
MKTLFKKNAAVVVHGPCRLMIAAIALVGAMLSPLASANEQSPLEVVASFTILGDMVKQVGGDAVNVSVIVGPESDAHTFEPRPSDAKAVGQAKLLIVNGLDFEAWVPRLMQSAGYDGKQVVASTGISAIRYQADSHGQQENKHDHDHDHSHDHSHDHEQGQHQHGDYDPHAWQSLSRAIVYVENIRDGLIEAQPRSEALFRANAEAYIQEMQALDTQLKAAFQALPAEHRKVISSHDAFAYLAADYGVEFISLLGVSNQAEPSAKDIASVISRARTEGISAIFVENVVSPKLVEQVARETGAKVGGVLYSDALAKALHDADSYLGMIRWNSSKLLEALAP